MNVLIIGCGSVGRVLAALLRKENAEVCCADLRRPEGIPSFRKVDASKPGSLLSLIRSVKPDVVVNASLPAFNLNIMRACLKADANYLDMASYWDFDRRKGAKSPYEVEQLRLDKAFKEKGLIGLINAGVSPGLTNLFAAECAHHLKRADSLRIRLLEESGGRMCFAWSKEWLLDELNWKPLVYRDGKFRRAERFSEEEHHVFPKPFGKRAVSLASQEEVGTLPLFLNVRNVDVKIYDSQAALFRPLVQKGLTSERKRRYGKVYASPMEMLVKTLPGSSSIPGDAVFAFTAEAEGGGQRARMSAVFPRQKDVRRLKANFISYPTALAAAQFILRMDSIKRRGVFPPECLEPGLRRKIIRGLAGVKIRRDF